MKLSDEVTQVAVRDNPDTTEAKRYQREKVTLALIGLIVQFLLILLLALWIGPKFDHSLRQLVGDNFWVRLLLLGFTYASALEITSLPLEFWSGFALEHRYRLSKLTLLGWIRRRLLSYLIAGILGAIILVVGFSILWFCGHWWWVLAGCLWLLLTVVLGQLAPLFILPLFYKVHRLDDPALLERLRKIAEGTGLKLEGIYKLELSAVTKKANAALTGMGRTRRVLLGDTLLEQFTPEEVEVVFAHEVGHHIYRHIPKHIALSTLLTFAGLFLIDRALLFSADYLQYQGTDLLAAWQDPSTLPLMILFIGVFGFVITPLFNAVSRSYERQCDRYALQRTGLVDAYRSVFRKLATINKTDPDPHPWLVWFFDDHPPIRERLAMADQVG